MQALSQVSKMTAKLDQRARHHRLLERYFEDRSPIPTAITATKLTKAYRRLMPMAQTPWAALVVESVLDRLEVTGINDPNASEADVARVWEQVWQANKMDAESPLAHCSGLISGRAFAGIWPDGPEQQPKAWLDTSEQAIVRYTEGSRRDRVAGLRRWQDEDDGRPMATLYLPDGLYKFQGSKESSQVAGNIDWEPRNVPDEPWPVPNPYGVVPIVEIAFNRRLKPGTWGYARGEYEHVTGLIDRINLLTFLGLVVAFYMGFPLRGVIGDKILRDDDGNVIPPFEVHADSVFQLENPTAKLEEFKAADRANLAVYPELSQLAAITKTPRHYFPLAQAMANLSADAIRADEGGLNAKVKPHKGSTGEGWEDFLRIGGKMIDDPVELSPSASIMWADHESRSMAERADAASKLVNILPWQALVQQVLNATPEQISQWEAMRQSDALSQLVVAMKNGAGADASTGAGDAAGGETGAGGPKGNEPRDRTTPEPRV